MERARRRRLTVRASAVLGALALVAVVAAYFARPKPVRAERLSIPGDNGPRITVEVLNATTVDGLARDVTGLLRRQGVDVVSFGSAGARLLDSTLILVRRGDSTAGVRVRRALGTGRVRLDPDARLLLDVSVLAGADLRRAVKVYP